MDKPVVAQKSPIAVELKKGETYYYCTCGKSDKQPFCNGAHEGTSFTPMHLLLKRMKQLIYVPVNILAIHHIVMEPMIS